MDARSFWVEEPGRGAIRTAPLPEPANDEVLVEAIASGVSRGTESLVFRGRVPASERTTMRCPFQEGEFPGPVKYGYASVGVVREGPAELLGRRVFCLHPHADRWVVPASAVVPLPDTLPSRRAVLAANVETAVNALWDAGPRVGDRVTVIGAGVVGVAVAMLVASIPGVDLEVVEADAAKHPVLASLGLRVLAPEVARGDRDLVVHASGSAAGLARAIDIAGTEALVLELSWFGEGEVPVPLGGAFHHRRLTIRASQVGLVAASRRARRTHRDRLSLALDLLARDARFDALLTSHAPLAELPHRMPALAAGVPGLFCHVVTHP